jgi:membrane-bound lytic murein transglycosylase MltF
MRTSLRFASLGAAALICAALASSAQEPAKAKATPRALPTQAKTWKGDFDRMVERRMIRVAVPYSRTLYFNDKGRERGITADLVRNFEQFINRKHAKSLGKRPITVYIVPTTRDELLQDVAAGEADIAAGNLTVTEARRKVVDFYAPQKQRPVSEIVLTGPKLGAIAIADELSGRAVHVRKASSYHESLVELNARLRKAGKREAKLVLVPDALEDEDMMEMVNVGLIDAMVVDDWKGRAWSKVLPKVRVNEGATLRTGGMVGWAIRKDSPKMREILDEFYADLVKKTGGAESLVKQYSARVRQLQDSTRSADWKRFEETLALFRKYGDRYGFDPLMLAAQGYQESTLDQNAKSHVGAVGIMQLMPATGSELKVGDIKLAEPNIHGGAKYMDQLMTKYFPDAKFDEANRSLFGFAAYNAGPGRIASMRKEAAKRGLDPDKWFNNVELVTAEKVGIETTTYVRNIYKYYAAYKLSFDIVEAQRKAREQVRQ